MSQKKKEQPPVLDIQNNIYIKGANGNNLQNISLTIPKDQLVVVTGVSGSGKSTITMDTLFAEGQRRYVESLSSYARQFLMRMKKPEVEYIKGICPAIAIEQKVTTGNNRSTVGSMTEIYDYLRLLYARIGKIISPISGKEVKRHSVTDVVDFITSLKDGTKVQLFIGLHQKYEDRTLQKELELHIQKGYTRLQWKGELHHIEDFLEDKKIKFDKPASDFARKGMRILIDRFAVDNADEDHLKRIADSVQTAFYESEGHCIVDVIGQQEKLFNNRLELDGIEFPTPSVQLFNYNNPFGACPVCEGYGQVIGISESKVFPDRTLSIYEGAIAPWRGVKGKKWLQKILDNAEQIDFPIHRPYEDLTNEEKKVLWDGCAYFKGITAYFDALKTKLYKIQNRVLLARYRGRTKCLSCHGGRLRKEATYVKVGGKSITELDGIPITELMDFFKKLKLSKHDRKIASRLLLEIDTRLQAMMDLGLDYLSIDRVSSTLSGGETQRINLTRTLGNNLTSSLYILDEPSVGLHPKDTEKLVAVLKRLRDLGNTVLVVEHEEEVIRQADYLIDMGPGAGTHGGHVVFQGAYKAALKEKNGQSLTVDYLTGKRSIPLPKIRRKPNNFIEIKGASQFNLKNIDVQIPLGVISVVTGVSGSGKTTLVKKILYPALQESLGAYSNMIVGSHSSMSFDEHLLNQVQMVSQSPIGKSSRSNPATYVKAYDDIRKLMAKQQLSLIKGFQPKHYSFNVDGGRCEACKGEGEQVVEMQFLADVRLECEACKGKRFKKEVLEVQYNGKNISDILAMTIEEALDFFENEKSIRAKIQPLMDVGLGYVTLGQSSNTLSGGEAQRVKLASFLSKRNTAEKILFIFDEPTTGLHFHDINLLLASFNQLVERGHSVLIVEHNMEVIKSADWVIDLGPGGGKQGGYLLYQGTPEGLTKVKKSFTGAFLKKALV